MKKTKKIWSASWKASLISMIGLAMVIIVNVVRNMNGEIDGFYIISEGVNYAIAMFALGAGIVAWASSNADRSIFGRYVLMVGLICAVIVGGVYGSWSVFFTFAAEGTISAMLVTIIPTPYP